MTSQLIAPLRGRGQTAVDQVQLIAVVLTVHIVAQLGAVAQAKDLAGLLAGHHAGGDLRGAVALLPLVGVGVALNGQTEVLGAHQHQVLDVVGVHVVGLGAGGALVNGGDAAPGYTPVVDAGGADGVEDGVIDAGFVETFPDLVPYEFTHFGFPPFNSTG